jgi:hypothetical protein
MKVAVGRTLQPLIVPFVKVTVIWNATMMNVYAVDRAHQSIGNKWLNHVLPASSL